MIKNLTRQEIFEIFNIEEPNCVQYDVVDYILELQKNKEDCKYKIEWLKNNILENNYASNEDKDVAEYQIDVLKEVYNG